MTLQGNQSEAHVQTNKSSCFKLAYISGNIIKFNKDETDKCFITMRFGEHLLWLSGLIPCRWRRLRTDKTRAISNFTSLCAAGSASCHLWDLKSHSVDSFVWHSGSGAGSADCVEQRRGTGDRLPLVDNTRNVGWCEMTAMLLFTLSHSSYSRQDAFCLDGGKCTKIPFFFLFVCLFCMVKFNSTTQKISCVLTFDMTTFPSRDTRPYMKWEIKSEI